MWGRSCAQDHFSIPLTSSPEEFLPNTICSHAPLISLTCYHLLNSTDIAEITASMRVFSEFLKRVTFIFALVVWCVLSGVAINTQAKCAVAFFSLLAYYIIVYTWRLHEVQPKSLLLLCSKVVLVNNSLLLIFFRFSYTLERGCFFCPGLSDIRFIKNNKTKETCYKIQHTFFLVNLKAVDIRLSLNFPTRSWYLKGVGDSWSYCELLSTVQSLSSSGILW